MLIIVGQQKAKSLVHVKALTDVRRWFAAKFSNNFDLQKDPFKFVSLVLPLKDPCRPALARAL